MIKIKYYKISKNNKNIISILLYLILLNLIMIYNSHNNQEINLSIKKLKIKVNK